MAGETAGDELAQIVRDRAGDECEVCGATEGLDVYADDDADSISLDALSLLCNSCHAERRSDKTISRSEILGFLKGHHLPFVTASMVADEFDVSGQTARNHLSDLVTAGELDIYEHNSKRMFYFLPDYKAANDVVNGLREHIDLSDLDPDAVRNFAQQPYQILPKSEDEYWVVVPRFLNFSVGHLHSQDEAWRTYIINKYVDWFSDLPDPIANEIDIQQRYETAKVDGQLLELEDEEERERAWEDFDGQNGPLVQREGDRKIRIQDGKEFDVISSLISGGNLPFTKNPIEPADIRSPPEGVTLRDYQREAWSTFEKYGRVGVFWPMGLGKSFWSLWTGSRIIGDKLVVVPSRTLQEQWESNIEENAPDPEEWDVRTYQYLTHSKGTNLSEYQGADAPKLIIFDECHYIPANKFSQLAMVDSDYTIGLSASPYREDSRSEYIFALTGVPVGIDWKDLVKHGVVEYPDVHVYSYRTKRQKREDLYDLVGQKPGSGLIFSDSREIGEEIADELGVPFVNGDTPAEDRADLIRDNRVAVASRVADEGLSIPELDWTIEHDFLGSSRRQEMQRAGRLLHQDSGEEGDGTDGDAVVDASDGLHIVQMTDREIDEFSERLHSLEEKGFNIQFERRK